MQARLGLAALLLAGMLGGGCTTIGAERVEGWPELEIVEHYVPHREMRERCARFVGMGMSPEACAEFDFAGGKCHIWHSADFPPPPFAVEHERQHCQGFEHAGEQGMREILANYDLVRSASVSASQGASSPRKATIPKPNGS